MPVFTQLIRITSDDGDWEAFYNHEGSMLAQGHNVSSVDLAKALGLQVYSYNRDYEWFGKYGFHCPENLPIDDPAFKDLG